MVMVQVTPLRRTVASSPYLEYASCHQQGHAGSKNLLNKIFQFLTGGAG